jgi:hypothetical protein
MMVQSVSSARPAPAWTPAMAAFSWYGPGQPLGADQEVAAGRHLTGVPTTTVLFLEGERPPPVVTTGVAARILEQQEGGQPEGLWLVGKQLHHHPGQTHAFVAQIHPDELVSARRQIPGVEDEIDDGEHRTESLWELVE